jgi:ClpP class serine protease
MPIPEPKKNEKKDDFMQRCMHEASKNKDRSNDQNLAICLDAWRGKHPSDKPKSAGGVWLANLHHKLRYSAWYILPSYFASLKLTLEEQVKQFSAMRQQEAEDMFSFFCPQRPPFEIDRNGIAVITVQGVLGNALAPIEKLLGMCDYEDIASEVAGALEAGAKAILFALSSPGGEANGAAETAAKIAQISIPKASFTSDLDASACYFLSCSCDYKVASPSAQSGAIGTIMPLIDESRMWDALGLEWAPITGQNEELKGAGMGPSLSDTEREYFQAQVNLMSAAFRDFVSDYRELDFSKLRGGSYFGAQALELNLIDAIGSYDQAYQWLLDQIDKRQPES